jgi:hypothetical protein
MALQFDTVPVGIPQTTGTFTSNEETTFQSNVPIKKADAAIKHFKLDAVGGARPSDIVQVGITGVTARHTTVEFTVKAVYSGASAFTGEIHVLVIADF